MTYAYNYKTPQLMGRDPGRRHTEEDEDREVTGTLFIFDNIACSNFQGAISLILMDCVNFNHNRRWLNDSYGQNLPGLASLSL